MRFVTGHRLLLAALLLGVAPAGMASAAPVSDDGAMIVAQAPPANPEDAKRREQGQPKGKQGPQQPQPKQQQPQPKQQQPQAPQRPAPPQVQQPRPPQAQQPVQRQPEQQQQQRRQGERPEPRRIQPSQVPPPRQQQQQQQGQQGQPQIKRVEPELKHVPPDQQRRQGQQQQQQQQGQPPTRGAQPEPKQVPGVQQQQQGQQPQLRREQPAQQGTPPGPPPQQQQGQQQQQFRRVQPAQIPAPQGQPAPGQPAPQGQAGGQQQHPVFSGRPGEFDALRAQRQQHQEGNRTVIVEPDRRTIVRDDSGRVFIRHDENERLRLFAPDARVERRGNETYAYYRRPGGFEIVDETDADGRLLRRLRRGPDGREFIIIDNRRPVTEVFLDLPPPVITLPRERYIVDISEAPEPLVYETLEAPPLVPIERAYSLDEVRYNVALRDRMRRVDVNTINFEFGAWEVTEDQVGRLQAIAEAISRAVARNANEVFMIEGHTDAVGSDVDNLSLSDRRAEAVANILTENFQIPPENLVTQGYGKQYLKVATDGPSRENRRVTIRRITPLLTGASR